ncbi:hypothetical protein MATL_G00204110 [Megalops atlanticus]|uniref:Uncharacterized protein n=1 Tax=Megalops atlanticus TaxID=7932 RepID=A0A9D3PK57_MEGAT|nr:hypothetical protein MATL_G00204110 [Megalops atlanticus]
MHHTHDPDCTVPESSRHVTSSNVVAVDCLFHESQGLLKCKQNDEAVDIVAKELNKQRELSHSQSIGCCEHICNRLRRVVKCLCCCYCCCDDDDTSPLISDRQ